MRNVFYFCLLTLVFSCQEDEGMDNIDPSIKAGQIDNFKVLLENRSLDNNLLLSVIDENDFYLLGYEREQDILMPKEIVEDFILSKNSWQAVFTFCNDSIVSLPYRGDAFLVSEESLVLNPFKIAPLSVLATFETPTQGYIKTRVLGKEKGGITFEKMHESLSSLHEIPIYGLYQDFENTIEVIFTDKFGNERNKQSFTIETEKVEFRSELEVMVNNLPKEEQTNLYFTSVTPAAYDTQGELRWWLDHRKYRGYPTKDGHIMIQLTGDRQAENGELEYITKMGNIINVYTIPNGVHHEVWQKEAGGNFLLGSSIGGTEPGFSFHDDDTEDLLLEIDINSRAIVKEWNMRELFDFDRERFWYELDNDWFHMNSIAYDPNDNSLLISSRHQAFVAKIGYDDKKVKWILGTHERWTDEHKDLLLEPLNFDTSVDPNQDWVYGQHSPRVTANGNILIYDNGMDRPGFDPDGTFNKAGGYVRAVEFKVDEQNKTVEKIWEHIPYDKTVWSKAVGSIEEKPNGNILQGHGIVSNNFRQILEVDKQGNVLFQARVLDSENFYRIYSFSF